MTPRAFNVLFLCTGNSARSIMAESILKHEGADKFSVYSAGSNPKGDVHPLALETLTAFNFPTNGLRSKSWDEFATDNAPHFDFIFTVCDNAAGEACPVWAGKPVTAHWGIEDPAGVTGSEHEQRLAFTTAFKYLRTRISAFSALPLNQLDKAKISAQLNKIGQLEGATETKATQMTNTTDIIIYHNPDCGTSRNTLAMIRNSGVEPHVVEYLKTPPSRELLEQLISRMNIKPRELLREKGTPYAELHLDNNALSDSELIDAMMMHPILINRPIVVSPLGVKLCRPSEVVLDILPFKQKTAFTKEDGMSVTDSNGSRLI